MTANIEVDRPTTVRVNGKEERLTARTVAELLHLHGIHGSRGVAVAVNGAVVPKGAWDSRSLAAGDQVEIVRPFGGG